MRVPAVAASHLPRLNLTNRRGSQTAGARYNSD